MEFPNTSRSHPTAYMEPMSSAQRAQRDPNETPKTSHQGASGGMRGAVGIILLLLLQTVSYFALICQTHPRGYFVRRSCWGEGRKDNVIVLRLTEKAFEEP